MTKPLRKVRETRAKPPRTHIPYTLDILRTFCARTSETEMGRKARPQSNG